MLDSAEKNSIQKIIEQREISCLCHFTPRKNVKSIKENGLLCRNSLPKEALTTDNYRYDTYSNSICLTIQHPNCPMIFKKWNEGLDLCLVILSPKILYEKDCLFFPHNAATGGYRKINSNQFRGNIALENLFANEVIADYSTRTSEKFCRNENFFINETTSNQAEVQCLEPIEKEYIQHILL